MKKAIRIFFILTGLSAFAQEAKIELPESENGIEVNVDFASRYIWRGQTWGGDYFVVQPFVGYTFAEKWTVGFWATSNFRKDFYPDGMTLNKGYQEFDISLAYNIKKWLAVSINDYYWPSVEEIAYTDADGEFQYVNNNYFDYGTHSSKTVDLNLTFDYSEMEGKEKYPFKAMISVLVLGNDYRYVGSGLNPKQNFTTYLEAGYTFKDIYKDRNYKFFNNLEINPSLGAVLNNQAEYYESANKNGISLVNTSVKLTKKIVCKETGIEIPFSLNYSYNNAAQNTAEGRNFLVAGVAFHYE